MMKRLTTTLIAILFIVSGVAAQLGEIRGTVKDEKGETMPGVTVYIEVGGIKQGAATDIDGKYVIKPVKTGKHVVWFSFTGYKTSKIFDVTVLSDKITYVDNDLALHATEMDVFIVEAKIHDIPLIEPDQPGVQHVLPKDLKHTVYRGAPIKIVTSLPGVMLGPNGKDVYIRGSRPQSTQFITDGMKSMTGDMGIPGQAIGSIKVYTGGVPARYGDITGGVIVTETKSYFDLAQEYE